MKRPAMFGKVPPELYRPDATRELIERHLDEVWARGFAEMDWSGMEETLVVILNCQAIDAFAKVGLSKDAIDAYTRRGHFPHGAGAPGPDDRPLRESARDRALRKAFNEDDLTEDDRKALGAK